MIIKDFKENCKECYACVRACPVKALKVSEGQTEVIEEKCIFCGRCVVACAQKGKLAESHIEKVKELLKGNTVVAILAPEHVASFYPIHPLKVQAGLIKLGFAEVQENILGEELIAPKYRGLFKLEETIIRSTCPSVVEWVEKFYPELIPYLAPVVSPSVAHARLIKAQNNKAKVVFIGPCIALKAEIKNKDLDAVLTFDELKEMFKTGKINLTEMKVPEVKEKVSERSSLFGGMPREELGRRTLLDTDIRVVRSADEIDALMEAIRQKELKLKFIDALVCNGCLDGPGVATNQPLFARKKIVGKYYGKNLKSKTSSESRAKNNTSPSIDLSRTFSDKKASFELPNEKELKEVLLLAKKEKPEDILNCGACGYGSCEETAIAIFQKLADWRVCYPYQKRLMWELIGQLKQTAITDGLTGLLNSTGFRKAVEREIKRSERYKSVFSLIIFDVDYFKLINDTYGHIKGDYLLSLIAQLLRKNLRETDVSARLGGDEFAIVLPEIIKTEGFAVAEKLREAIKNFAFKPNGKEKVQITISCGVAVYCPESGEKADELMNFADKAMYKAKKTGRNRTCLAPDQRGNNDK